MRRGKLRNGCPLIMGFPATASFPLSPITRNRSASASRTWRTLSPRERFTVHDQDPDLALLKHGAGASELEPSD